MLQFDYNSDEKVMTFKFSGRQDTLSVTKFSEIIQINLASKEGKSEDRIIFDLKEVDYISSAFIRICLMVAKQAAPGQFSIINCQPFVKKTFNISGLEEILKVD